MKETLEAIQPVAIRSAAPLPAQIVEATTKVMMTKMEFVNEPSIPLQAKDSSIYPRSRHPS
jgi:hypothetical protein